MLSTLKLFGESARCNMKGNLNVIPRDLISFALAVMLFVCSFLLLNCKSGSSKPLPREPIELPDSVSVSDMLKHAGEVATSGTGSCSFRFSDSNIVTLEFPLLDGNIKHWQFKVIQEVNIQRDDVATQETSDAIVIFASCGEDGWRFGGAPLSDANLEQQVRGYAATHARTVLIIRASSELPAKRLEHVWHAAQSAGVRVVVYES